MSVDRGNSKEGDWLFAPGIYFDIQITLGWFRRAKGFCQPYTVFSFLCVADVE